jgi:PhzF family phenazine biosynthesis protein
MIWTPLYQVDAFTQALFAGNPAAVCPLPGPADPGWMQTVAAEMNISETAFVYRQGDAFQLRWFTPTLEVDLCGHATLATAHILWETGLWDSASPIAFDTRSGRLSTSRDGDWIVMDFPAVHTQPAEPPAALAEALKVNPVFIGRNQFDYLVEVATDREVRDLAPDMARLATIDCRGVIVTSRASDPAHDFVSRFFGPAAGIPEDPVTGSAHCCLGPYWQARIGKDRLIGHQVSARGGIVIVEPRGDRVLLSGQAVTVLRGHILGPPTSKPAVGGS